MLHRFIDGAHFADHFARKGSREETAYHNLQPQNNKDKPKNRKPAALDLTGLGLGHIGFRAEWRLACNSRDYDDVILFR